MLNRRVPVHGLLAVLLALMAQLGIGATVPRLDPLARIVSAEILCHAPDGAGDTPPAPDASARLPGLPAVRRRTCAASNVWYLT